MESKRKWVSGPTAIVVGLVAVAVVALVMVLLGVFSPTAPVNGGLAACESTEVEADIRRMVAAEDARMADLIVSIQEVGREQTENVGEIRRRDCQATFRTEDGYRSAIVHLIAQEGGEGPGWRLEPGEAPEPPVAAPLEGAPPPTPPDTLPPDTLPTEAR